MGYPPIKQYGDAYQSLEVRRRGHALLYRLTLSYKLVERMILGKPQYSFATSHLFSTWAGPVEYRSYMYLVHVPCEHCSEMGVLRGILSMHKKQTAELSAPLCLLLADKHGVFPPKGSSLHFDTQEDFGYRVRFEIELVNG